MKQIANTGMKNVVYSKKLENFTMFGNGNTKKFTKSVLIN